MVQKVLGAAGAFHDQVFGAAWSARPGSAAGQWSPATLVETLSSGEGPRTPRVVLNDAGIGWAIWGDGTGVWAARCLDGAWAPPSRISGRVHGTAAVPPCIGMNGVGRVLALSDADEALAINVVGNEVRASVLCDPAD